MMMMMMMSVLLLKSVSSDNNNNYGRVLYGYSTSATQVPSGTFSSIPSDGTTFHQSDGTTFHQTFSTTSDHSSSFSFPATSATQDGAEDSNSIERYKSDEVDADGGIWYYQLTSKPATTAPGYGKDYFTQLCQQEFDFGYGSSVVDWSTDLKSLQENNEIGNLLTALKIDGPTFNENYFFVKDNGEDFYGDDNRKYFFENHAGNPPSNWLVHDQLGDISLGSWYDIEGQILCKYRDSAVADSPTPPPTDKGPPQKLSATTGTVDVFPPGIGAPKCGTILTQKAIGSDTNKQNDQLLLGPFKNDPATKKPLEYSTECSGGYGSWFAKSYYAPSYASTFTVSQKCEYLYRTPTTGTCTWCIPVICYVMLCYVYVIT